MNPTEGRREKPQNFLWDRSVGPANVIPLESIAHYAQVTSIWGLEGGLVLAFSQELGWRGGR